MESDWKDMYLGDVAELIRGVAYKPESLLEGPNLGAVPLIRATNIGTRTIDLGEVLHVPSHLVKKSQLLQKFDVVIAMSSGSRAAVGRLAQLRKQWHGTFGAFCGAIRPVQERVDPEYLGYVLCDPAFRVRIDACASGTAIMNLSRDHLLGHEIQLPNRIYQRAVAKTLGSLDDRIDHNRALAANLEAIARRLFKSWFVDFDPVRAKAAGEKPAGLADDIAALFPVRFVESEIGEVPEGWNIGKISDFSTNVRVGCTPSQFSAEDFYVGLEHFDRRCLTLWNGGRGDDATSNKSRFARGDLLFGKLRPYFHKVAIAPMNGICSTDILVIRCSDKAYREFMYFSLFQDDVIQYVSDASGGTRMPRTNWEMLAGYDCVLPSKALAAAFGQIVAPMIETMMQCVAESSALTKLRNLLLPRLISGKLRVEEAESMIEEAVA